MAARAGMQFNRAHFCWKTAPRNFILCSGDNYFLIRLGFNFEIIVRAAKLVVENGLAMWCDFLSTARTLSFSNPCESIYLSGLHYALKSLLILVGINKAS